MTVRELECQIAKAQISRYVAGETIAPEAMSQLEKHVEMCPDCKAALSERRNSLLQLLDKKAPQMAAIFVDESGDQPQVRETLGEKLRRQAMEKAASKPVNKNLKKPLMYASALAGVLLAMSYVSNNMSSLVGPKLLDSNAPAKSAATKPAPQAPPVNSALETASFKLGKSFASAVVVTGVEPQQPSLGQVAAEPVVEPIAEPAPQPKIVKRAKTVTQPSARKAAAKPAIQAEAPAQKTSGIRIYLDGKVVN